MVASSTAERSVHFCPESGRVSNGIRPFAIVGDKISLAWPWPNSCITELLLLSRCGSRTVESSVLHAGFRDSGGDKILLWPSQAASTS